MTRHHPYEESVPAYVLGALPQVEAEALERHLEDCSECTRDLERLRIAADALPRAVDPIEPPASLKESLMSAVRAEARVRARAEAQARAVVESGSAPVTPRGRGRSLARRIGSAFDGLRPAAAWASAAVLVVAGLAGGWALSRALDSAGGRTIPAEVDRSRFTRASGSLVVAREDGQASVLRLHGMRPPPSGKVYALWLRRGDEVEPGALFTVASDGSGAGAIEQSLEDVDEVMVTRERAGGAPAPTEEPVVRVDLS